MGIAGRSCQRKQKEKLASKTKTLNVKEKKIAEKQIIQTQQKLDTLKQKEENEKREKELATKQAELNAREQMITHFSRLEVKDVMRNIEHYIMIYGSAVVCMSKINDIIFDISKNVEQVEIIKEIIADKPKDMRENITFTITDPDLVPDKYKSIDERKIKEDIKLHRKAILKDKKNFTIAGVEINIDIKKILR